MATLAAKVQGAITGAGIPITGISIGQTDNRATWTVEPATLQGAAQPIIDAFDPNATAVVNAELDQQVAGKLDQERIFSAIVWAIIDTYSAPATIGKFTSARAKIVSAYKAKPWAP